MVIGLVAAGWIAFMGIAVALCRMAGRADDWASSAFIERDVVRAELNRLGYARPGSRESRGAAGTVLSPR